MIADNHNHFVECGDAVAMARAGERAGLAEMALTEHVHHLTDALERIPALRRIPPEGPALSQEAYVTEVGRAQAAVGIRVGVGIETEFMPDSEATARGLAAFLADTRNAWDVVIGSVHLLADEVFLEDVDDADPDGAWRDYGERLLASIRSEAYDVIGHPTRLAVVGGPVPERAHTLMDELALAAVRHDVALEVNAVDLRAQPALVHRLISCSAARGAVLSLGSDAHAPDRAAAALAAPAALRDAGVSEVATFVGGGRRMMPLGPPRHLDTTKPRH
ncbi:PHP domain-containing protein [Conexibacter woesei]|uniref:Histidinol-phosphatase n=1 Tax=Conexibacter woesei (strain DSM 14684 / CCUG 47730 / CIP 108061 / JCM 11494 / NBRC 100937 / ID131577) TaxID=469383 RepID=D3F7X7_CONWI|nr:PHP domain-containing protein [Conexibacter woesei]ADB52871.1 PHP domain protein [Conexibacter woesei DSM 14684]